MIPENYGIQRMIEFARQGYRTKSSSRCYNTDWDSDAYLDGVRPELEQLGSV